MKETVSAKLKLGRDDALRLTASVGAVVVVKGKKILRISTSGAQPDNDTIIAHMLGPTGRLRAPTLRLGRLLIVGFHKDLYDETFSRT